MKKLITSTILAVFVLTAATFVSASPTQDIVSMTKKVAHKTKRGTKYAYSRTKVGGKWVYHKGHRGGRYTYVKVKRGGKWTYVKTKDAVN